MKLRPGAPAGRKPARRPGAERASAAPGADMPRPEPRPDLDGGAMHRKVAADQPQGSPRICCTATRSTTRWRWTGAGRRSRPARRASVVDVKWDGKKHEPVNDGTTHLAIANAHPMLSQIYRATAWNTPPGSETGVWVQALMRIRDALPSGKAQWYGLTSRGTLIPVSAAIEPSSIARSSRSPAAKPTRRRPPKTRQEDP